MAKVMISLPDDLLARVDAEAERRRSTRSGVMREFAAAALDERSARLAGAMRKLPGAPVAHGGDAVAQLRAGRPE